MTAYADGREHLRDELRRLDLLLQRYLSAWRAERGGAGEGGGMYVSDAQVDCLLQADPQIGTGTDDTPEPAGDGGDEVWQDPVDREARGQGRSRERQEQAADHGAGHHLSEDVEEQVRDLTTQIGNRERESLEAGIELPLVALADRFGLTRREVDVLLVALAPELDLKYETVYAYLQNDLTRKRPTTGLALRVAGGTVGSEATGQSLFTPGSPLLEHRLLRYDSGEGAMLSRPVEVDRRIVAYLLGEDELAKALAGIAEVLDPGPAFPLLWAPDADEDSGPLERLPVDAQTRNRLADLSERLDATPPAMVHLHGPYGSGRVGAARALAETADRPLLEVDAERLPAADADEILRLLRREATLREAAIHVRNLPLLDRDEADAQSVGIQPLLEGLDAYDGPVFLSGETPLPPRLAARRENHSFSTEEFDRPSFDLRRSLWEQVDVPGDPEDLASKFWFTPGQIEDTVATARSIAVDEPTEADVFEASRAQSRERLGDLARQVDPHYGWEDIVLPDLQLRQLREVAAQIEHRGTVYSDWGFEKRYSHGTGVTALFAGPSGTGKTMAANILASETGLDLYKIDLANVVSKYIGETEKNLGKVFDEAESSNVILFFDEADALFGKRSEVSDAHDRYANIEVDYLLERMEGHDGVVLLATNLEEHMDSAFERRINLTIEFPLPDRDARERIWRHAFPEETPVGDLDWAFLAGFELTGGGIKNAALSAAFLAADEDTDGSVEMRHAVPALWSELQKGGRLISPDDFGEYRAILEEALDSSER